ncbi:MAG: lipid A phosphoethanolamine transferase [Alistipes sp.]|nr:lipid A phosphoethanolamine transferase [Alistipes sp.]
MPRTDRKRRATLLTIYFVLSLMIPGCVLMCTEDYAWRTNAALLLLPAGLYLLWANASNRSGLMIWLGLPMIVLSAFQIVLLYLFGNSVIAADMFTNVITTNPGEAGELLSNIWPAVLLVGAIYLPLLWYAALELGRKHCLRRRHRRTMLLTGCVCFVLGSAILIPDMFRGEIKRVLRDEIYPVNAIYNAALSAVELRRITRFEQTSHDFTYGARRTETPRQREIYVYIIGEASRAASWQLFGYERETNPELSRRSDLQLYDNMLTQSNTTHKSVPTILSSVATAEHDELFNRKGLPALFNEAGFRTCFISNQSPNGAMIDKLAADADEVIYIRNPRMDMQLLEEMQKQVMMYPDQDLFFILHCYGSHFAYHQRYPRAFARWQPDDDVAISASNVEMLLNAYDNSIYYTDCMLNSVIEYLSALDACSAMLYCADHGEDLFDDARGRFLHASPTTTYYQLHVAALSWFSDSWREFFPEKAAAAEANRHAPATTHSLFHTMADMAAIECPLVDRSVSLVSGEFDYSAPRFYLNDHNEAVPHVKTGLKSEDMEMFGLHGIEL